MAYIIGLANEQEIKELMNRGWKVEEAPLEFLNGYDLRDSNDSAVMVFVDRNLFEIMNGPDWEGHDPDFDKVGLCTYCDQHMIKGISCTCKTVEFPDGEILKSVPYDGPNDTCPDCNVKRDGYHHPGCDQEFCPRCGGQLISCGCLDEEEEEEDNG